MRPIGSVGVKAGILNTIAKSIYSDKRIKTREAVSNSMDNNASSFIITVDESTRSISFLDNGYGISQKRFNEIFSSIGYGQSRSDDQKNSYFGLGLMSILQLGRKAQIISRCINDEQKIENNLFKVNTSDVFSEKFENKAVECIKDSIRLGEYQGDRAEYSSIPDEHISTLGIEIDSHFTEILLEEVDESVIKDFSSSDFVTDLKKILPLAPDFDNDPFFSKIQSGKKLEKLKQIMNNDDYCKTIDVYYGKRGHAEGYTQLYKYYPTFKHDIFFADEDIRFFESSDKRFMAYFVVSSQHIEASVGDEPSETGFWVRNRNILVKSSDFFQKPGTRKKIVDEPLKTWIYGEVFHKDMTEMLVVTRDEYLWDNMEFQLFHGELKSFVENINKEYREIWQRGKKAVDLYVEPFKKVKSNVFKGFDNLLINAGFVKNSSEIGEYREKLVQSLYEPTVEEGCITVQDELAKSPSDLILKSDYDGDITICIAKTPLARGQRFVRQRNPENNALIIKISPSIFESFETTFLAKSFKVIYVLNRKSSYDISVNKETGIIYVNLIGDDVSKFSITIIEYLLIAKAAYLKANSKDEMYNLLIDLVGRRRSVSYSADHAPGNLFKTMEDIFSRR